MTWERGQTVELCTGPVDDAEVYAERTISRVGKRHMVLSSGSMVRLDGRLVNHPAMFIRPKTLAADTPKGLEHAKVEMETFGRMTR